MKSHKHSVRMGLAALGILFLSVLVFTGTSFAESGTGPADAYIPTGATMTAQPGTQTWYKFHESGNAHLVKIALDANGQTGVFFRVYTPESIAQWIAQNGLHPIGVSSASPGHDQVWLGRFQFEGTYYAVVENSNAFPVDYRLTVSGEGVTTVVVNAPTPTPLPNPYATEAPVGALSGGKLVFQESSGGNIYTVNADGTNLQRVTFGMDPAFSPDGAQIAFTRQGPIAGLYIINADGTNERLVFGANQVRSPTWVDNTRVVFATLKVEKTSPGICFRGRCFGGGDVNKWSLKEYNLQDSSVSDVITPPTGGTAPSYNRVLDNIAFMNPEKGLMLTTLEDDAQPQLLNDDLSINTPVMSPDGARMTYMVSQPPAWQVVVAVWDGTQPTLLTKNDPLSFEHPDSVAPTFSPDGQEILFLSNRNRTAGGSSKWEFFAMNNDGTNLRQVLKNITDGLNLKYNYSAERVASWVE
ncbi:MAG: PD40 domain-containing protein [Chloroflexi bacterium]|nr:PD40 domain-containing protein [Chloroflexota bacterium]